MGISAVKILNVLFFLMDKNNSFIMAEGLMRVTSTYVLRLKLY
jgi:hypothetical protein